MKRKVLITLLSIMLLICPVTVFAVEEESAEENNVVVNEVVANEKDKDKDKEHHNNNEEENDEENPEQQGNENAEGNENENNNNNVEVIDTPQDGLPLVIIRVDEREETINAANLADQDHTYGNLENMNGDPNHDVRAKGTVEILIPDGYVSEYGSSTVPEGEMELEYVRGRGNVTWKYDKRPYKIKLVTKQEILGMGASKEWGLLANYMDQTLSSNAIVMQIAREFGMEYTVHMIPVEFVLIGSNGSETFLGSYYLTELVDIGSSRVNIKELDDNDTWENKDLTGGYLLSLYYETQDYDKPESTIFELDSGLKFMNENPEFESEDLTPGQSEQRTYIRDYMQQIENLILNNETIDEATHNQIDSLMDLQSTADYWLIQEFFINFDAYKTSSNYLYKKRGGKLYWGPLWDFDLMFYLSDMDTSLEGFNHYTPNPWIDALREKDPLFVELLKSRWEVLEPILASATQKDGLLDQDIARQTAGWNTNNTIWDVTENYGYESINEPMEELRHKIDYRRNWFNNNLDKLGDVHYTVTLEVEGEIISTSTVRAYSMLDQIELKPQKEGQLFNGWVVKETQKPLENDTVISNLVLVPAYVDPNTIEEKLEFYFSKEEAWVPLEDGEYDGNEIKVFPSDVDNNYYYLLKDNLKWSSSNEAVATVENGVVTLHSIGETTITATSYDGASKSYILHIFGDEQEFLDEPEDFYPEKDSYTIEIGENVQIIFHFTPNTLPINPDTYIDISREVGNDKIIEVDYSGNLVVTGKKPGETTISVTMYSNYSDKYSEPKVIKIKVVSKKEQNHEKEETTHNKKESNKTSRNKTHSVTTTAKTVTEKNSTKEKTKNEDKKLETSKKSTKSHSSQSKQEETKKIEEPEEKNNTAIPITLIVISIGIAAVGIGLYRSQKKDEE